MAVPAINASPITPKPSAAPAIEPPPVSFLTTPLFKTRRGTTPASPVAVRCARLRAAAGFDLLPAMFIGLYAAKFLFVAAMFISVAAFSAPAPTPSWLPILTFLKPLGSVSVALTIGLIAILLWFLPHTARWFFDRAAPRLTREKLARQRRLRHRGPRITLGFALLSALLIAAIVIGRDWQTAAITTAGSTAIIGGMLLPQALFARRGHRPVCARCDYPMSTWRGAGDHCRECGNPWRQPWGARLGPRAVSRRGVIIALAALSTSVLLSVCVATLGLR